MAIFQDSIINELKMRLELLEKQNEQKAYLMQEKLLFWLVGESIRESQEEKELLNNFLERISELMDVPISLAFRVEGSELLPLAVYSLQDRLPTKKYDIQISTQLLSLITDEPLIVTKNSPNFADISFNEGFDSKPRLVSFFPIKSSYIPFGLFIFIEEEKDKDSISSVKLMIQQLIFLLVEKHEKIKLNEELKSLNNQFELKLKEKERELEARFQSNKIEINDKELHKEKAAPKSIAKDLQPDSIIELLKNIGVEMRTPLNGIQGFAELLRDDELNSEEKNHFIDIIKSCGKSLLKIVEDAISYSVIKSDQVQIIEDKIDLTSFMTELYDQFKKDELFRQRDNLDIKLNINVNGLRIINTDSHKLNQIFTNLIGNSIKFTSKGVIEIGCNILSEKVNEHSKPKELLFYVKDTGVGIEDEIKDNIYDEFFKVEHEISRLYGGIGLGLSITQKLVYMLGGRIWFETKVGEGTQFYFTLPISVLETENNKLKNAREGFDLGYNWEDRKLLIVEDDAMSYLFLREILKPTKIIILHAPDGRSAIDIVTENLDIDLILMDIKLPGISGYEATKQIKKIIDIPVIAQTAYAMLDDHTKILEAGCDDYISKPINRRNLLRIIDLYLKRNSTS